MLRVFDMDLYSISIYLIIMTLHVFLRLEWIHLIAFGILSLKLQCAVINLTGYRCCVIISARQEGSISQVEIEM